MKQIVLMYHDVYRDSPSESGFQNPTAIKYKVRADRFEAQVAAVADYLHKKNLPSDSVDFTFDDGGETFLTVAAPILEKYGFRGKFYIATAYIGTDGFLDADALKELKRRGHTVGAHSHTHPERMSTMQRDEICDEWNTSQMILTEVLGATPVCASIPNGYSSKDVLDAMDGAGIKVIDTSAPSTKQKKFRSSTVRGRYAVTESFTTGDVIKIVSSPGRRMMLSTRYACLGVAKAILGESYLKIRKVLLKN